MKVKLVDGSTAKTMAALQPELARLKLDDNLPHLITLDEWALGELHAIQTGIRDIVMVALGLFAVLFILSVQSITLLFERYVRKVVVRRLFGFSWSRRYREFLGVFGAVGSIQVLLALVMNSAGVTPFATATTSGAASTPVVLGVAAIAIAIELAFSAVVLVLIERRRTTDVLKGEF